MIFTNGNPVPLGGGRHLVIGEGPSSEDLAAKYESREPVTFYASFAPDLVLYPGYFDTDRNGFVLIPCLVVVQRLDPPSGGDSFEFRGAFAADSIIQPGPLPEGNPDGYLSGFYRPTSRDGSMRIAA